MTKCHDTREQLASSPDNWVIDVDEGKRAGRRVTFRPVFVRPWAYKFFDMAELFLMQSATIIDADAMAEGLGLPMEDCIFIRAQSEFDPEKRPIYYKPLGSMSRESIESTLPVLVDEIKSLMDRYPDEKGVIHTHTYKIQDYIMKSFRGTGGSRLMANDGPDNRDSVISKFMKSNEPRVLVTPSAYEGMDFRNDICRWQVICKIPYPNLGDSQVKRRMEADPRWYQWKSVLRLVQTYGRGTRSEEDWCDTYLLDSSFTSFSAKNLDMLPEWFTEAFRHV